jgi:hypothetical protein
LRFPYNRQWRQGFPYIFGIVTGEVSVTAVDMSENAAPAGHKNGVNKLECLNVNDVTKEESRANG